MICFQKLKSKSNMLSFSKATVESKIIILIEKKLEKNPSIQKKF